MNVNRNLAISALMAGTLLAGCSQAPQQRYQAAVDALEQAQQAHSEAAATVTEREQALSKQKQKLAQARKQLQAVQERLQKARNRVDKVVSDQVLFRAIQRALLDSERFPSAAIAVGVEDRVVTLTGTVPDETAREAALAVTRNHPGVRSVQDRLAIARPSKPASKQGH